MAWSPRACKRFFHLPSFQEAASFHSSLSSPNIVLRYIKKAERKKSAQGTVSPITKGFWHPSSPCIHRLLKIPLNRKLALSSAFSIPSRIFNDWPKEISLVRRKYFSLRCVPSLGKNAMEHKVSHKTKFLSKWNLESMLKKICSMWKNARSGIHFLYSAIWNDSAR